MYNLTLIHICIYEKKKENPVSIDVSLRKESVSIEQGIFLYHVLLSHDFGYEKWTWLWKNGSEYM